MDATTVARPAKPAGRRRLPSATRICRCRCRRRTSSTPPYRERPRDDQDADDAQAAAAVHLVTLDRQGRRGSPPGRRAGHRRRPELATFPAVSRACPWPRTTGESLTGGYSIDDPDGDVRLHRAPHHHRRGGRRRQTRSSRAAGSWGGACPARHLQVRRVPRLVRGLHRHQLGVLVDGVPGELRQASRTRRTSPAPQFIQRVGPDGVHPDRTTTGGSTSPTTRSTSTSPTS